MVATVTLPPNKTYALREATIIRACDAGPTVTGVVEIRERHAPEDRAKCSRYAIKQDSRPGALELHVRFTKPAGKETYHVCLPADELEYPVCECVGYLHGGWCRHIEALIQFQNAGHFNT